jgi:L-alanine-DL-glutamate epimerase-like enolase superfamily enzyme
VECYHRENRNQETYDTTIIRLRTGAGLTGIAESRFHPDATREVLQATLGHSPWEYIMDDSLGGILIAIYDLVAQIAGIPIAKLLSPEPAGRVQQVWWSHCFSPKLMQLDARTASESGYRVHKFESRPWFDAVEQAAAISHVVAPDYRLWLDAKTSFGSVGRTIEVAHHLQRIPIVFALETPIAHADNEGYRELHRCLNLRLADSIEERNAILSIRESLVDSFVTRSSRLGRSLLSTSSLCEFFGVRLWLENGLSTGVGRVFQAHVAAACPAVEFSVSLTNALEDDCVNEPFSVVVGAWALSRGAGLGITLDDHAVAKYRID